MTKSNACQPGRACRIGFATILGVLFTGILSPSTSVAQTAIVDRDDERTRNLGQNGLLVLSEKPEVQWAFHTGNESIGACIAIDGMIYAVLGDDMVVGLLARDGRVTFKTQLATEQITGLAARSVGGRDYLVITSYDGIYSFNPGTGEMDWHVTIPMGLAPPIIEGESAFAASFAGEAHRFNLIDGDTEWSHDFLADAPPDPVGFDGARARFGDRPSRPRGCSSDGRTVFFSIFDQCRVIGIDIESGERQITLQTEGWIYNRPVVADDLVIVGSQDKNVYAMDRDMGHVKWTAPTGARVEASSAIAGQRVYFGSCDGKIYCANRRSGDVLWDFETPKLERTGSPIYEQPIVTNNGVLVATMNGDIFSLNAESGEVQWQTRVDDESQIIEFVADAERVYVVTRKGFEDQGAPGIFALGATPN